MLRSSTSTRGPSSRNRTTTSRNVGSGSCATFCAMRRVRCSRCTAPRAERSTIDDDTLGREDHSTNMNTSLDQSALSEASAALREANLAFAKAHPGESPGRQPVHTVYGGAQLFFADSVPKLGALALRALDRYASDPAMLGRAVGISEHPALDTIHRRVRAKLEREPVEDFRIDFEDGYGNRPDAEEDGHAESAATEVVKGMQAGTLPPFIGIRIKPFNEELRARSCRTLD